MSLDKLKNVLATDPLGVGYDGMTAKQVRASLYTANCPMPVESVTGHQIFEAAEPGERDALTPEQTTLFLGIVGMGTILVNGPNTRAALLDLFGPGTTTRDNLAALQTTLVSLVVKERLGSVALSDIDKARP